MSLADDLLEQARLLARCDQHKPKQANLRRAVSSAYYGLFHHLIDRATATMAGVASRDLRQLLARSFQHGEMRSACACFGSGGALPKVFKPAFGNVTIPSPIRQLAATFVELHDARQEADYDLNKTFIRTEVVMLLDRVSGARDAFDNMNNNGAKRLFLVSLLTWDKLARRN